MNKRFWCSLKIWLLIWQLQLPLIYAFQRFFTVFLLSSIKSELNVFESFNIVYLFPNLSSTQKMSFQNHNDFIHLFHKTIIWIWQIVPSLSKSEIRFKRQQKFIFISHRKKTMTNMKKLNRELFCLYKLSTRNAKFQQRFFGWKNKYRIIKIIRAVI